MLRYPALLLVGLATLAGCTATSATQDGRTLRPEATSIERGRQFAAATCAGCHAIGATGESPHPKAPPFPSLTGRYPGSLEEALTEGVAIGHPEMPPAGLAPQQISDLVAYLGSFR